MSRDEYSEVEYSEDEYSEDEHSDQLSATMAMLSETYPTVVYYKKAVACGLPEHYMDLWFSPDKWGRVPCKREAMDWYLRKASNDEEAKREADAKHKKDLEAAECHMNLDTSKGEIVDGKVVTVNVGKKDGDSGIQAESGPSASNNPK